MCARACAACKTSALFHLGRLSQALCPFQQELWKIGRWGTGDKGRPAILLGASPRLVPRQKPKSLQWSKTPKAYTFSSPLKSTALYISGVWWSKHNICCNPFLPVSWWRDSENRPPENRDVVMTCRELSRCCLRACGVKPAYKRLNTGDPHRDGQPEP